MQTLVKQGKFLEMTKLAENDATWKSYIYNLPKGTMKWLLNSCIDTLPTKVNLKQWGKTTNDKCFCNQRQTLNHILNCCKISLDQGRFTFRHDSVLNYIAQCLDKTRFSCFIDIPGHQTPAGGTLPPSVLVTSLKPDVVVVDKTKKSVTIFELTVPAETRIATANKIKTDKYEHFKTDISNYKTEVIPFEVGSHMGQITDQNKKSLNTLHKFCKKEVKLKHFVQNISAVAALGSYYIFNCRNEKTWESSDYILAPFQHQ